MTIARFARTFGAGAETGRRYPRRAQTAGFIPEKTRKLLALHRRAARLQELAGARVTASSP